MYFCVLIKLVQCIPQHRWNNVSVLGRVKVILPISYMRVGFAEIPAKFTCTLVSKIIPKSRC